MTTSRVRIFLETLSLGVIPAFDFPPEYEGKILFLTSRGHVHQHSLSKNRRVVCEEYEDGDYELTALRVRVIENILAIAMVAGEDGSAVVGVRSSYVMTAGNPDSKRPFHVFSYALMFATGVEPERDEPIHPWIPRTVSDPEATFHQVRSLLTVTEVLQS